MSRCQRLLSNDDADLPDFLIYFWQKIAKTRKYLQRIVITRKHVVTSR